MALACTVSGTVFQKWKVVLWTFQYKLCPLCLVSEAVLKILVPYAYRFPHIPYLSEIWVRLLDTTLSLLYIVFTSPLSRVEICLVSQNSKYLGPSVVCFWDSEGECMSFACMVPTVKHGGRNVLARGEFAHATIGLQLVYKSWGSQYDSYSTF